ncbi:MAG: N-acyl homoserine lactone hydrolase [Frankiales bacterium]|nr:N-acyl homoserine lactone hydrolase [Frankiales bacterium]
MTGVRRVVPITFGWEDLPETISIHGGDRSVRYREPVPGVLVQLDGGWLLLDTGFNVPLVRDPHLRRRLHGGDISAELRDDPRDSLEVAFETVGISPDDVTVVALSHLHNDHAGGLRWFTGRCPVHLQRAELAYGLSGPTPEGDSPEKHGFFRVDYDDPHIDWQLADDDVELAPGVTAVMTPGHTPGHQSFVIDLDATAAEAYGATGFVLAFDAADLQRNIDEELSPGGMVDPTPARGIESIRRLKAISAERGYQLVPGHDPLAWPAFTKQLGVTGP